MSHGLLVVGEVVTDVVARPSGPLAVGTDTHARTRLLPGGAGANAACWAARSGARTTLLARVGRDAAGWHRDALAAAGVRTVLRGGTDADPPTAVVIALVAPDGERTLVTDSGASLRLEPADWDEALLAGVGRLHVSGYLLFAEPARSLARLALAGARRAGVAVSVDPASAGFLKDLGPDRFLDLVGEVDTLFPNRDEALLLAGTRSAAEAARALSGRCARTVAVTLGADGALVSEAGGPPVPVPPAPARVVDTTGAGDAFCGAFLAARLRGEGPVTAAVYGCRAGAEAVARPGARPAGGPEAAAGGPAPAPER